MYTFILQSLLWRHNERNGVSNHRRIDGLLNRIFRHRSDKTSKLRVTGLYEGISPVTGEFPAQRTSNAENVSIWWRHHVIQYDWVKWNRINLSEIRPKWICPCRRSVYKVLNSSRPSDAICRHISESTLAQAMACCLTAPRHYLNQCWLIISKV